MRKLALSLLICCGFSFSAALPAQVNAPPPPPTVDDYVCTFSGDCADNQIQAEDATNGGRPHLQATRGFALSRPDSGGDHTAARHPGPAPRQRAPRNLAAPSPGSSAAPTAAPGQRVILRINFENGSAKLAAGARSQADALAQALLRPQLRNMHFMIEGHTDSVGRHDRNLDLSQRRAQTLADYLVAAGVARDRLVVHGYGPDRPLPGVPANAGENRRVEAVRIS
jgi:outer membrane protein OmpA-like peptidoglycan-associated protein